MYGCLIFSGNYSYPSVMRVKRSFLENLVSKALFRKTIGFPTMDWEFPVGSEAVGGSAGVLLENSLDLLMSEY